MIVTTTAIIAAATTASLSSAVASILRKVGLLAAMEAAPYVMERIVHMSGPRSTKLGYCRK
jgi:hypothetical protein